MLSRSNVLLLTGLSVVALFVSLYEWSGYKFRHYPENAIRIGTCLQVVHVLKLVHTDHDWYVEAKVNTVEAQIFHNSRAFQRNFNRETALAGKYFDRDLIQSCSNCDYRIENRTGPYSYVLYVLSADERHLQAYEMFGG